MMDCSSYRRAILADPHNEAAPLLGHLADCGDCRRYTDQVRGFEGRLGRALRLDVDAPRAAVRGRRLESIREVGQHSGTDGSVARRADPQPQGVTLARRLSGRWLVAASLLLAAVVAGGLWLAVPEPSLAADVVSHMAGEPNAWATDVPVPAQALDAVLNESHVRLKAGTGLAGADLVTYANSCLFRGHRVPHLVVQTATGPVTVMVLPQESSRSATRFEEGGYRGVIVPVPAHGSIAVLTRGAAGDIAAVRAVATQVQGALVWTG